MRDALCPYFGRCGGCSAQHIEYAVQLDNKRKMLGQAVQYDSEEIKVFSGNEFGYRNRMDLIFHQDGLGFREKGKWQNIVDIQKCVISNDKLNKLLKEVRDFFKGVDSFDVKRHYGTYRYAVIRTPQDDSSISFVLNADSMKLGDAIDKIREFAKKTSARDVIVTRVPGSSDMSISDDFFAVKGEDMLKESYLDKDFMYSVQGFFQNNHEMAERMVGYVKELISKYDTEDATLLDLYGGVGGFGIVNSGLFKEVVIVESDKHCIDAAKQNIEKNSVKNAKAVLLDAAQLKKLEFKGRLFVITDPPRSGMHPKTVDALMKLDPEVLVYVSCNVQQLGKELIRFRNHTIKSAAMFDLFPQTPHCEAVLELVRR